MSKKAGVLGICLSLSVASSLTGSLFLIKEINSVNHNLDTKVKNINTDLDELAKQIEKVKKDDSALVGSDLESLSSKVVELENKLGGLETKVDEIPVIVQVEENGDISAGTTKPDTTKPDSNKTETTKPDSGTMQTAPTVENPVFKTNTRLNFRHKPTTASQVQKTFNTGEVLTWVDNTTKEADGYTWIQVKDSSGTVGWVAQKYTSKQ